MHRPSTILVAFLCVLLASTTRAAAAEIRVLCSNGLRAVIQDIVPAFQRDSSHVVVLDFGPAAVLKGRIEGGEAFDVAILTPEAIDALVAGGHAAPGIVIARSPLGLAMKAGASQPAMDNVEGLKHTLRAARSIAYAAQGAGARPFLAIVEQLGLSGEIGRKLQPRDTGAQVGQAVSSGAIEYGVIPISEILPVPGVAVAGAFPPEVRVDILMVAAVASRTRNEKAAADLIRFLSAPANEPILSARGMQRP